MSIQVPSNIESEINMFQRHLIPADALWIRYAMTKAAHFANDPNPFYAHTIPIAFAVAAVVMTAFNVLSYLFQIPLRMARNIVCFSPVEVVKGLVEDVTNVARSLMYIPLGMTFISGGVFFPKLIFSNFAPDFYETLEERLIQELKDIREENARLVGESAEKDGTIGTMQAIIFKLEREVESLKQKKRRWFC